MRSLLTVALVAAIVGIVVGVGMTWADLGPYWRVPPGIGLDEEGDSAAAVDLNKPLPKVVVVGGETYDFGYMEQDTKGSHDFVIRNDGDAPLTLIKRDTTCKCTFSSLDNDQLQPGASTKVQLEWTAVSNHGAFRHSAMIETNDPHRQHIRLTLEGKVGHSHKVFPDELVFTSISVGEETTAELFVHSFVSDEIKILSHEFLDKKTADRFDLRIEEMSAEQVKNEERAKSGKIAKVVIKPGLPLGPFQQTIRLTLDLPGKPIVNVLIEGSVVGDISILGPAPSWNDELKRLNLGRINREEGAKSKGLYLLVKGDHRDQLKFEVRKVEPDFLKINFEKPEAVTDKVVKVPFTIEVPPGSPAGDHTGGIHGRAGSIEVDTGHPTSSQLKFNIAFMVER
jgi:hypothetical protein